MPIFMDRHDLAGTSAAEVAEAHLKDLGIQDRYGVKFLTYWFDQRRGNAFCLMDAPDAETAQCVHREAHGFVAGEVVEVALSAVEAFLGRIHDPEPASEQSLGEVDSGHRAILFTDIVGSTEMTSRLGDRMATEMVRAHDSVVRRSLGHHMGREVKHTGDGIMATFASTAAAVDCAIEIQQEFQGYNRGNPEPIHVRIGLDCGEPVEDSNDLFGTTVQLAARLCAAASTDQILVSEKIFREYGAADLFAQATRRRLKGFSKPVLAFQCDWAGADLH
ncbi:cyclase [Rhizobium sp. Root1203]|uniref:nickel-binding protein n=1 Tax=Rhizobium sp. Root1203 TaxID=1736427 RepID=UPI00070A926F|nr:nickel-binding protein [Rhizobium sp. Root1203]KQV13414.1 cyclase [Rhizobium sp. Root1203]